MNREQVERQWFLRAVMVLMVAALTVGAVPIIKNTFFPVEKSRS